jgi:hypothetical protein
MHMLITVNNLFYYLLEKGLITSESLVDGDFLVVDITRRNRNFKVIRKHNPSYFVKQIQQWEPQEIFTLEREAMCYGLSRSDSDFAPLALLIPKFYAYDPKQHVLIVEMLPEGENLSEYHRRSGEFPLDVASQLGKALGTFHHATGDTLKNKRYSTVFPTKAPWILSVHQYNPYLLNPLSGANTQLLSVVQKYSEFQQTLDDLYSQWEINSFIHGDMKWDNCIVYTVPGQDKELHLKIVDWEMADFGDACWDVGAIFQAYLSFWVMSMPMFDEASPTRLVETTPYPLEKLQPSMLAFWKAYVAVMQMTNTIARAWLERSMKYAAARMIQTAYEYMAFSPQISVMAVYLLQVSMNILKSPQEAISDLLGL